MIRYLREKSFSKNLKAFVIFWDGENVKHEFFRLPIQIAVKFEKQYFLEMARVKKKEYYHTKFYLCFISLDKDFIGEKDNSQASHVGIKALGRIEVRNDLRLKKKTVNSENIEEEK